MPLFTFKCLNNFGLSMQREEKKERKKNVKIPPLSICLLASIDSTFEKNVGKIFCLPIDFISVIKE